MPEIHEIRVKKVRKVFGRQVALRGVSCTLQRGRVNLILGPNGAGKSTLMKILGTLSQPTTGELEFAGAGGPDAAPVRLVVGQVDHAPMLYRHLSSRENLRFFARMYGVPEAAATVERWIERVGLAGHGGRPVRQLSRGMVQRVALARALLHDPAVVLLDEPFTGLDRDATELLRRELAAAADAGKVVVLTTHELDAVDGLCGHLVVLRRGQLVADVEEQAMSTRRLQEHYHAAL